MAHIFFLENSSGLDHLLFNVIIGVVGFALPSCYLFSVCPTVLWYFSFFSLSFLRLTEYCFRIKFYLFIFWLISFLSFPFPHGCSGVTINIFNLLDSTISNVIPIHIYCRNPKQYSFIPPHTFCAIVVIHFTSVFKMLLVFFNQSSFKEIKCGKNLYLSICLPFMVSFIPLCIWKFLSCLIFFWRISFNISSTIVLLEINIQLLFLDKNLYLLLD